MISFVRRLWRHGRSDPEALMADLRETRSAPWRSEMDRHRDFRAVFLGNPQGRRVLRQIFAWARLYEALAARGDPYETYRREGERMLALRILHTLNAEPAEQATRAEREKA